MVFLEFALWFFLEFVLMVFFLKHCGNAVVVLCCAVMGKPGPQASSLHS